jgi:2-C-methyl-D-erythritol 4-phosphate cytidylyltransferase / 2-C-methyl-D-erythritol 2,4-cyclodiphosphate synthase
VAIIAAAGQGSRFGTAQPKQLLDLAGRTMLQRSVDAFDASSYVDALVVVLPAALVAAGSEGLIRARKPLRVVAGGPRRQDSVANGFDAADPSAEIIIVHDAARPFVSPVLIERAVKAAQATGAALVAMPARDTVKQASAAGLPAFVDVTLPRDRIFLAQTPQAFRRDVLRDALAIGRGPTEVTDEATLAEMAGHTVALVEGEAHNMKITTPEDLAFALGLLGNGMRRERRAGTGYDLHRMVEGRPLILGGVRIPSERGLSGHSDADAICHAVTDAILGAACAGDIGRHFPDADPRWKGASSVDLLARAAALVEERGFLVENVDVVVVLERPRLAPFIDAMRSRVAVALGIDPDRVSIKGKTNEGVDAIGRGEALAVHAVAMLEKTAG